MHLFFLVLLFSTLAMHLYWSRIWCYSWHYRSTYNFIIICCMLCYVIDCDVQCNEEKVRSNSPEYNLIVDLFQGISNHVVRIKVKWMFVCVCRFQIAKHLLACMRSIFKFIIVWCMIILMYFHFPNVENRLLYKHSFLWLSNVSLSLS